MRTYGMAGARWTVVLGVKTHRNFTLARTLHFVADVNLTEMSKTKRPKTFFDNRIRNQPSGLLSRFTSNSDEMSHPNGDGFGKLRLFNLTAKGRAGCLARPPRSPFLHRVPLIR
jgi:hypothetical protein